VTIVEYAWIEPDPNRSVGTMPEARLVLIVGDADFMLWEFAADGTHAGDTFHLTQGDAEDQARHQFGRRLGDWIETAWIPEESKARARGLLVSTEDRFRAALASEQRSVVLGALAYFLTMNARGLYEPDSVDPRIRAWECHNELLHVLAKQQLADSPSRFSAGYPDDGLFEVLLETARARGCDSSLIGALDHALQETGRSHRLEGPASG
jgi:hypothetical protein